jgi:hypothetical protein
VKLLRSPVRSIAVSLRALAAWAALVLTALACGNEAPTEVTWKIDFACPSEKQRATRIQIRVLKDMCGGTDTVYEFTMARGEAAEPVVLPEGEYYFELVAFDRSGKVVAAACPIAPRKLPAKEIHFDLGSYECLSDAGILPEIDAGPPPEEMDAGTEPLDATVVVPLPEASMCPPEGCGGGCPIEPGPCECGTFEGHAYLFCAETVDWLTARNRCRELYTDLAIIESAGENAFIHSNIGGSSWIGANDRVTSITNGESFGPACDDACRHRGDQGNWTWIEPASGSDGESTFCSASEDEKCAASGGSYMNWAPNQPDNAG